MAASIDYGLAGNAAVSLPARSLADGGDTGAVNVLDPARLAPPPSPGAKAASLYKARRRRAQYFAPAEDLFGEPAWDVLLDLFVAHERNQKVSVSSVSAAACVPTTTALRIIAKLTARGMIEDRPDPHDKRRRFLRLTESAVVAMQAYLLQGDSAEFWAGKER